MSEGDVSPLNPDPQTLHPEPYFKNFSRAPPAHTHYLLTLLRSLTPTTHSLCPAASHLPLTHSVPPSHAHLSLTLLPALSHPPLTHSASPSHTHFSTTLLGPLAPSTHPLCHALSHPPLTLCPVVCHTPLVTLLVAWSARRVFFYLVGSLLPFE